jgi:ATP-dependent RNA helicase DeaD
MKPPTLDEALEGQQKAVLEKILQSIDANNLQFYKQAAEELLEQQDATTVVAAVLKMLTKEPDTTPVKLTEEKPLASKRDRRPQDRRGKFESRDRDRKRGPYKPRQGQGQGQGGKRHSGSGKPRTNSFK